MCPNLESIDRLDGGVQFVAEFISHLIEQGDYI